MTLVLDFMCGVYICVGVCNRETLTSSQIRTTSKGVKTALQLFCLLGPQTVLLKF